MAQLKERDTEETVDNQLIPDEVERLRELGVEVEESEQDGNESGGDGSSGSEDSEDPSDEETGGSGGDGEEADDKSEELDNSGLSGDDLDQLQEESDVVGEEGNDQDVDEHVDAIKMAGGGSDKIEIENYESFSRMNEDWERLGKQYGRQLAGVLVDHFKQERRTAISHGEEDGHFDSNQLIDADRGSPDVFYQRNNPDEKKYHAVIAMDDSGSMGSGGGLKEAAVTTGMLVHALEEAGIQTTVYRFAYSIRLVKSAAQSYDETKDGIYEQATNGGTSLLPAIEQAEEIAENHADETFLVVVTDGRPSQRSQIKESLQSSDMKSITVQIKEDHEDFKGYYDGWVLVEDQSEVPSKTQSAFRRVML